MPYRLAMVGRVGVEPTTSRLSGVRSNHLSYRPIAAPKQTTPLKKKGAAGGVSQLRQPIPDCRIEPLPKGSYDAGIPRIGIQ